MADMADGMGSLFDLTDRCLILAPEVRLGPSDDGGLTTPVLGVSKDLFRGVLTVCPCSRLACIGPRSRSAASA